MSYNSQFLWLSFDLVMHRSSFPTSRALPVHSGVLIASSVRNWASTSRLVNKPVKAKTALVQVEDMAP